MKTLGKLNINTEKLMKNEELITVKGGSNCWCFREGLGQGDVCLTGTAGSADECSAMCGAIGCYPSFNGLY